MARVNKQLTNDPQTGLLTDGFPGRSLPFVFVSTRGFPSLWRIGSDGSNLKQLTNNCRDYSPQISVDGQWIVFWLVALGRETALENSY